MSNDLAIYANATESTLKVLGRAFCESGMFGCTNESQGLMLALQCAVERKPPLELAKTYHLIGGKLSMRSDAMQAGFQASGGKIRWIKADATEARAAFSFGETVNFELAYSVEDAKAAGLLPAKAGSGWAKFPAAMLRARLISQAVRMLCPQVNSGAYTPEEIEDFSPAAVSAKSAQPTPTKSEPKPVKVEVVEDVPYAHSIAEQVAEAVGENEEVVNAYCIAKGRITEGRTWRDLDEPSQKKLLKRIPEIIAEAKAKEASDA